MNNHYLMSSLKRIALFLFMEEMCKCWFLIHKLRNNFSGSHMNEIFENLHNVRQNSRFSYPLLKSVLRANSLGYNPKNLQKHEWSRQTQKGY